MLVKVISDETQKFLEYDKFMRLCDLFFFIPGKVYKQKNDSENMYLIMSSMARKKAQILCDEKVKKDTKQEARVKANVEKFWVKMKNKFHKIGDMFRFFDRNFDNEVSFNEFRCVIEELDLRFNS
jgi:hypothetical protein